MYMTHKRRLLAGILLSAALLSGCTSKPPAPEGSGSAGAGVSAPAGSSSAPEASQPDGGSSAAGSGPADGSQELEVSGSGEAAPYDFSQPAPEREAVDNSYFEDAAFVGDSRTDGFMIYSGIGCGENLTSNGLSIFKLEEKKALTIDGQKYTLLEALALKQYGKVYLSLGVNELGYYDDQGFYDAYCKAIDDITGADGQLPADASKDGVHLRKAYCERWLDYLKTHTVDYETLYSEQEGAV